MTIRSITALLILLVITACNNNNASDDNNTSVPDTTMHGPARLRFSFDSSTERASTGLAFQFRLLTDDGKPVDPTVPDTMDCIVTSEDLSWFGHTTANKDTAGVYHGSIGLSFNTKYSITAEYKEEGYPGKKHESFDFGTTATEAKPPAYTEPKLSCNVDGYEVRLLSKKLSTNVQDMLIMKISKDGQSVLPETIQSLSGEQTHMYCFNTVTKEYLHATPKSDPMSYWYLLNFPKTGLYRAWIEFMTGNKVHVADFVIRVD